jgi:hypothetical protein
MWVLLAPGDEVRVESVQPAELRPGDVVLIARWGGGGFGEAVVHRVLSVRSDGGGLRLLTKGDTLLRFDPDEGDRLPLGRVEAVGRQGRWRRLRGSKAERLWPLLLLYSPLAMGALWSCYWSERMLLRGLDLLFPAGRRTRRLWAALAGRWCRFSDGTLKPSLHRLVVELPRRLLDEEAPASAPEETLRLGVLTRDETWSGTVRVVGPLIVAAGARLTLAAGARIVFEGETSQAMLWPFVRPVASGWRETHPARVQLLVHGELEALGTPEAPVSIEGAAWSGIHLAGSGRSVLRRVEFSGGRRGISCWDGVSLLLEDCRLESRFQCVAAHGRSRVRLERCRVESDRGPCVETVDEADVSSRECVFEAVGPALIAHAGTTLGLRATRAESREGPALWAEDARVRCVEAHFSSERGRGAELFAGSRLDAEGGSFLGRLEALALKGSSAFLSGAEAVSSGAGALALEARSELSVEGGSFRGVAAAVSGRSSRARMARARLEGGALALELRGGRFDGEELELVCAQGRGVEASGEAVLGLRACALSAGKEALALKGSRAELAACELVSERSPAAGLEDGAALSVRGGRLSGSSALALDSSEADVEDAELEGRALAVVLRRGRLRAARAEVLSAEGGGVEAKEGSAVRLDDARVEAGLEALRLTDSRARLSGVRLNSAHSHAVSAGESRLECVGGRFDGEEAGLAATGSTASLRGTSVEGGPFGIYAQDARLVLADCALEGVRALQLKGGSLRARGGTARGGSDALALSGCSAELDSVRVEASAGCALNLEDARVACRGARLEGGKGACLASAGSRLDAVASLLRGGEFGLKAHGSDTRLERTKVEGGSCAGLDLAGGRHRFVSSELSGCPPPGVAADARARIAARTTRVLGAPWAPSDAAAPGALRRELLRFVLRTRGVRPWRALWRLAYRGALGCAAALSRACGMESLFVYRGWRSGDWEAGVSDLDLHALCATGARTRALFAGYAKARVLLPMLGELLACSPAELEAYLGAGGVRAREFAAQARAAAGRAAGPWRVGPRDPVTDFAEAAHAYTRLMLCRYPAAEEEPVRRSRNLRKALLDVLRYAPLPGASPEPLSRTDAERREEGALPLLARLREAPERLDSAGRDEACARALMRLDAAARALPPAGGGGARLRRESAAEGGSCEAEAVTAFDAAVRELEDGLGARDAGVLFDDGYRLNVVLPDAAARSPEVWAVLDALRASRPFMRVTPLVLTRAVWDALSRGPYLHHPTAFLDGAEGARRTGGRGHPGFRRMSRGPLSPAAAPGDDAVLVAARQSVLHLGVCWRSMLYCGEPLQGLHHLYTRTLGLRLLGEAGVAMPFTDLEAVLAAAEREFPGLRGRLAEIDLAPGARSLRAHHDFLEEQLLRARLSLAVA